MMVDRTDINHLLAMTQSWASLKHSVRIVLRHLSDRLSHARGTRLVMGNALVGRLLHSLSQHAHATLALNTSVDALERDASGRVVAVGLSSATGQARVLAKKGVVLASGGFNRDPVLRSQKLPGIPAEWCPAAPGHTGEALALARSLGAVEGQGRVLGTCVFASTCRWQHRRLSTLCNGPRQARHDHRQPSRRALCQ
jgi:succinate dehydrogenase/fumarate reductase flavoprotein subunit